MTASAHRASTCSSTALEELDDVEVVVVAPADDRTGSSRQDDRRRRVLRRWRHDQRPSRAPRSTASRPTRSTVALDELGLEPDLVVSGINKGQNVGTAGLPVGHRRRRPRGRPTRRAGHRRERRARRGHADFDGCGGAAGRPTSRSTGRSCADGTASTDAVVNINVPDCTAGEPRELLEVPLATEIPEGVNPFTADCTLEPAEAPADDVLGLAAGYPVVSPRPAGGPRRLGVSGPARRPPTLDPRAPPRAAQGVAGEAHARALRGGRPARRPVVDRRLQGQHRRPAHRRGAHPAPPGDPHLRGRGALRPRHRRPRLGGGDGERRHDPRRAPVLEGVEPAVPHRAGRAERLARTAMSPTSRRACGCRASTPSSPASSSRSTASRPTSACPTAPPRRRCPTSSTASSTAPRPVAPCAPPA